MSVVIKHCNAKSVLLENFGEKITAFIKRHLGRRTSRDSDMMIVDDVNDLNNKGRADLFDCIISTMRMNDYTNINEDLSTLRGFLNDRGILVGNVETNAQFGTRVREANNFIFGAIAIWVAFVFKRLLPKIWGFRFLYKTLRLTKSQMLSKCEALGRLVYCGFKISAIMEYDNRLYFVAQKSTSQMNGEPCDGIFVKIRKEGLHGRPIYCYKLRTMHAYASYLHDYVLDTLPIDNNGKVVADFRVPGWARLVRRLWLDEMPQLFNILKGELSFIGLRHLSKEFLDLYPDDWRTERMNARPGFVPPYYADCPTTFNGIIESEKKYYRLRKKHPITTDIYYFMRVVINFLTMRARTG